MKIRALIGNPISEEWEEGELIELLPSQEVFSKKHPSLPLIVGFEKRFGIEVKIRLHGAEEVFIKAYHDTDNNSMSLIVMHNGKCIVHVIGQATNMSNQGLSVMFTLPDVDFPVELRCEPDPV